MNSGARSAPYENYNGNYVSGTFLCHTGQTTGFSCGNTTKVNAGVASPYGCSALINNPTATCAKNNIIFEGRNLLSASGDSGGPVFDGSGKAYAILSGSGTTTTGRLVVASPIRYGQNMGFVLKTGM